tara:strand:+ start:25 stop:288 length:264 start_codon:yes stop_codon:yes gene_type:complete
MKKVTLSVAALAIALTTFGQTSNDSLTFSKNEVEAMMITLEEILYWQAEEGNTDKHSNYWITELVAEMRSRYTGKNNYIQPYDRPAN